MRRKRVRGWGSQVTWNEKKERLHERERKGEMERHQNVS